MTAGGIQFQGPQRLQDARGAELQHRIGEGQVVGVFRHDGGQAVIGRTGEKQHLGIIEKLVQLRLGGAQRPLLHDFPQARAGAHQGIPGRLLQGRGVLLSKVIGPHPVVVVHHAQPDGIDLVAPLPDQVLGRLEIIVGTDTLHLELVAQEAGPEFRVQARGAQADAGDAFHKQFPCNNKGG